MSACIVCGSKAGTAELLPEYRDAAIGLPLVLRNAAIRHHCPECGMEGVEIPDMEGLEAAAALARLLLPVALSGPDLRFLRKACSLTGKAFAAELGVDASTLSRWEHATTPDQGAGRQSEILIRDVVANLLHTRAPAITIPPGTFARMTIIPAPTGPRPEITMERVRLKDTTTQRKSDAWDVFRAAG